MTLRWISRGFWSGTRRIEILADASAGITVLAPSPLKPPQMPLMSRLGRVQMRSSVV